MICQFSVCIISNLFKLIQYNLLIKTHHLIIMGAKIN